jgi:P4 family phage/plasmid primase-like protien
MSFIPSHTTVLYTNHLPRVGAIDAGTWRRIQIIPFNAKIAGGTDVKNYCDFLVEQSGGAILQWIIDGAKRVISKNFQLVQPAAVQDSVQQYRDNNNWLAHFLTECCEQDQSYDAPSGITYQAYRTYCAQTGEFTRSRQDFNAALMTEGFTFHRTNRGMRIIGFRLNAQYQSP